MEPGPAPSKAWVLGFLPLGLLGALQFLHGGWVGWSCFTQGLSGQSATLCIDPYWVNQWLKNYAGGFSKRGLLGELLRHLHPGPVDLLGLNLLGLLLLLVIYGLLYWLLLRLICRSWGVALLFSALLVLSPLGKSLAETALDPLQVCVLLLASLLLTRPLSPQRDALMVAVYLVSSLIYEGCLLLLLPAALLLMRPRWSRWLPVGLGVLLLGLFQQQDSAEIGLQAARALQAINPWTGQAVAYQDGGGLAASVSFAFNVKQEFSRYLSDSPRDTLSRIARSLGVVLAVLLMVLTAMGSGRSPGRRDVAITWLWFAPFAFPFVLITHDWLRYGVVILLMALVVVAACQASQAAPPALAWSVQPSELFALVPLVVMTVAGPGTRDVRKFLPHDYFYGSLALLGLAVALLLLSLWWERAEPPAAKSG